jgi:hypothetical protein
VDLSEACVSHADRDWADLRDANVSDAEPQRGATDSSLVAEGVRVLTRALKRIERMTGVLGQKFCNRKRATTRRGAADFARGTQSQSEGYRARLEARYRRLGFGARHGARCRADNGGTCGGSARLSVPSRLRKNRVFEASIPLSVANSILVEFWDISCWSHSLRVLRQ